MKGLPGVLTYREVPEQQTSHPVGINLEDSAASLHRFGQIPFIKALFNHVPDCMESGPVLSGVHERLDPLE